MSMYNEYIIPKGEFIDKMPSGLQALYIFNVFGDEEKELTEKDLKSLLKMVRTGEVSGVYLGQDTELEGDYMLIEISQGLIYIECKEYKDGTDFYYSSFNPAYLDSEEEAPMNASDGQSIILMRYTMSDFDLAASCIEYYARTGKLYPNMEWLGSK